MHEHAHSGTKVETCWRRFLEVETCTCRCRQEVEVEVETCSDGDKRQRCEDAHVNVEARRGFRTIDIRQQCEGGHVNVEAPERFRTIIDIRSLGEGLHHVDEVDIQDHRTESSRA